MPRDPVNGIRDVRPDLAYPLAVYAHLFNCTLRTVQRRIKDGHLRVIELPGRKRPTRFVLGVELWRLYGEQAVAAAKAADRASEPTESAAERLKRAKAASDRVESLRYGPIPHTPKPQSKGA